MGLEWTLRKEGGREGGREGGCIEEEKEEEEEQEEEEEEEEEEQEEETAYWMASGRTEVSSLNKVWSTRAEKSRGTCQRRGEGRGEGEGEGERGH